MNKQELIKKYEYMNHDCFRRVDVSEVLADLRQLDEPKQIKLKDVIVRMEGLSEHTRSEWLNDILYKFGSDYGTLKYKDGYEQGKLEGSMIPYEEPQKVTIPQFVAGWIEQRKDEGWELSQMFLQANLEEKYGRWIVDNQETFARAWLDGYEVEKEKRYLVKMKGLETDEAYLKFQLDDKYWYMGIVGDYKHAKTKHTRKELEEAGFGWVFDCKGIEIKEVKE